MFAFLRKADHTTSRKTRKGRDLHNKCPGVELLEGRVVLDAAGSTLATAQNIGALIGRSTFSDFVGSSDPIDFRRFSLTNPGSLNVLLNGLSADADLDVRNSAGTVIASSTHSGTAPDEVNLTSLAAGTYFVEVHRFDGANTNYNLTLTADYAGNSTAAARNLGTLNGQQSVSDFVGSIDPQDFYRINLAAPGSLNVLLNGLSADADLDVRNSAGTVIASSTHSGTAPDEVNLTSLAAGTYFVEVHRFDGANTNYNLTLTADYAGNSTAAARNLGTLNGQQSVSDFVGSIDPQDFYRINLAAPGSLNVLLNGLSADADLDVRNSAGTVIASSTHSGTAPDEVNLTSLAAGTYFVEVHRFDGANTNYNLTLTADYAGNSTAAARNLGTFFGTRVFRDFIGAIDTSDFYRINLPTFRIVTGTISGLSADADLNLRNSAGTVIASSTHSGTADDSISRFLVPGTYYFQVYRFDGANTNYNFTLTT